MVYRQLEIWLNVKETRAKRTCEAMMFALEIVAPQWQIQKSMNNKHKKLPAQHEMGEHFTKRTIKIGIEWTVTSHLLFIYLLYKLKKYFFYLLRKNFETIESIFIKYT